MNLTFKGFLKSYCRELTGSETSNLKKLLAVTLNDAPRAAEALVLYALVQNKLSHVALLAEGTWVKQLCEEACSTIGPSLSNDDDALAIIFDTLPDSSRFKKVWRAYQATKYSINSERRVAGLMREKTVAALQSSDVTCYRLCKDLGLNMGNVYAYLNKNDTSKVSLNTARRIMEYALDS